VRVNLITADKRWHRQLLELDAAAAAAGGQSSFLKINLSSSPPAKLRLLRLRGQQVAVYAANSIVLLVNGSV